MLAGGIHTNTARPRTAKNLAWKIANVPFFRTVLNNDWEERSQMRTRTATSAEKRGNGSRAETELCCAALQEPVPAPLCAAHLGCLTQPSTRWNQGKSAQGTGGTGSCEWIFTLSLLLNLENGVSDVCGVDSKMPSENTLRIPPGLKTMLQPLNDN